MGLLADATNLSSDEVAAVMSGLHVVGTGTRKEATVAVRPFLPWLPYEAPPSSERRKVLDVLRADDLFPTIAWNLAAMVMVIADLESEPGERRQLKVAWEEDVLFGDPPEAGTSFRALAMSRMLGWHGYGMRFPAPAAADAKSFHFEVLAPEGIQISRARLDLYEGRGETAAVRGPTPSKASGGRVGDYVAGSFRRAHLYSDSISVKESGLVWVRLRPLPGTLIPPAVITTSIVLAAFVVLTLRGVPGDHSDSAVAALLVAPSALAIYVVRPFEHGLTSRLLFGIRSVVTAAGLLAFAAAAMVATDARRTAAWWVAAGLAFLCWLLLLLTAAASTEPFRRRCGAAYVRWAKASRAVRRHVQWNTPPRKR
jgi:hypothetical protein